MMKPTFELSRIRCAYCRESCKHVVFYTHSSDSMCADCVDRTKPPFIPMHVRMYSEPTENPNA